MKSAPNPAHYGRGFSLVEVMVALIVISVGLLGCAKLGALLMSSTGTSRLRSLVALEAASLADSIHADRDFWDASSGDWTPATGVSVTATESSGTTTFSSSGSSNLSSGLSSAPVCESGSGAPCSAVNMASYDLTQWATALKNSNVLQNSTSTITCASLNSIITCTVTINWQENTVASNSQEAQAGAPTAFQNESYTLVVQP